MVVFSPSSICQSGMVIDREGTVGGYHYDSGCSDYLEHLAMFLVREVYFREV